MVEVVESSGASSTGSADAVQQREATESVAGAGTGTESADLDVLPTENPNDDIDRSMLYIQIAGGSTNSYVNFVRGLLGNPAPVETGKENTFQSGDGSYLLQIENKLTSVGQADVAFCFIGQDIVVDESKTVQSLSNAIRSLRPLGQKMPFVIAYSGPTSAIGRLENMLRQAWLVADTFDHRPISLYEAIDVKVVLTPQFLEESPGSLSDSAVKAVSEIVREILPNARSFSDLSKGFHIVEEKQHIEMKKTSSYQDIDAVIEARNQALQEVLQFANKSIDQLNKFEGSSKFSNLIEDFIQFGNSKFSQLLLSTNQSNLAKDVLVMEKEFLVGEILERLQAFFRRQVNLIRVEIAKEFNRQVADDLEITVHVMEDLQQFRNKALSRFRKSVSELLPKSAKLIKCTAWNADTDLLEFQHTLDDYNEGREAGFKALGVLPRGDRKPIDISFHMFLAHPLGRDYRQDILSARDRDELVFDESLTPLTSKLFVHPVTARKELQKIIQDGSELKHKKGQIANLKRKSEFAREMLMFPLSVKNPDVAMNGNRRKRKGSKSILKKDPMREEFGPER